MNIFVVIFILVAACAVVSATMPNRRLGSRYTNLDYSQENDKLYKPISRKAAFWMEFRVLALLVALVAMVAFFWMFS
jgi:hypothetical protein